jgi:hypothetical protein
MIPAASRFDTSCAFVSAEHRHDIVTFGQVSRNCTAHTQTLGCDASTLESWFVCVVTHKADELMNELGRGERPTLSCAFGWVALVVCSF